MAVELIVKLSKSGQSYTLKAERITHSYDRSVSPNPLPSGTAGSAGQVFYLDLGQCVQTIIIEGLIDSVSQVPSGANQEPTKAQLGDVVRTWYVQYSLTGETEGGTPALLTYPGGSTTVFFKSVTFTMVGALEDRWQYSLVCFVT